MLFQDCSIDQAVTCIYLASLCGVTIISLVIIATRLSYDEEIRGSPPSFRVRARHFLSLARTT